MNNSIINNGVYPVMITPYKKNGEVDYRAAAEVAAWYEKKGCQGIFAACLSSEIYFLSEEERLKLIETTLENVGENTHVVASGHCISSSLDFEASVRALKKVAERGVKSVVLIAAKLAEEREGEDKAIENALRIADAIPNVDFGLYEAPHPYHRLISADGLGRLAESGRFVFFKDTCCDANMLHDKLKAIKGTKLKLFNANSATLLDSMKHGADGYSGVMCNYHPELYVRLDKLFREGKADEAEKLQDFIGMLSLVQYQMYPLNAKYYLQLAGLPIESTFCRSRSGDSLTSGHKWEIKQMYDFYENLVKSFGDKI